MKKIAYIELDTHAEIAAQFMALMQNSESFSVDYFFSPKIAHHLKSKNNNSEVFISNSSSILAQLKTKNYDLVIIGSVHRYFHVFQKIVLHYHSVIVLHNANFSKATKSQLLQGIFKDDILYRLKLLIKENLLSAPKIYQEATHHLVLDKQLENDKAFEFPLFYHRFPSKIDENFMTLVIPGEVSQKRRNYHHVFSVIKNIDSQEKLRFIFLGKAKGKELRQLQELKKNTNSTIEILFFDERVPQDIFDEWMQKADVLWCPIQKENEFLGIKEIYGKTKITGNIGDAITYGKWAIFPKNYPSNYPFIVNETDNFLDLIRSISIQNYDFQKEFSQKKTLEKLENTLLRLLK